MPELPEVETTARALRPYLENQPLTGITTSGKALRQPIPALESLLHQSATSITRRAKYILANFTNNQTLILHLGMSGRIIASTKALEPNKHHHLNLTTPKGNLILNDPRRFGLVLLHPTEQLSTHPLLTNLGPEPLEPTFTATYLHQALAGRNIPIKVALMNPAIVVGVGNIYASESLFLARINPLTPALKISPEQCGQILSSIRTVLTKAINAGGTTLIDYRQPDGKLGHFSNELAVYGRRAQPCLTCSTPIESATLAQRSTFWCPHCQPA